MIKNILHKYHYSSRLIFGLALFFLAIVITGIIEGLFSYKKYFPFTGMFILLIVTWALYRIDNQNLNQLGLNFQSHNYKFLILGFVIGISAFFFATILKHMITGQNLHFNNILNLSSMLLGLYYLIPNVVVEELLFRGYLFKKVISKTNIIIANIIFSFIFMLVHVLDSQILSSLGATILMAITIPVGHLLFATALLKSKTILFPIGLHLGNNWATGHLITKIQNEQSLLYISGNGNFETWSSFIAFIIIWNGFYLFLTYLIWKWPINVNNK